MDDRRAWILSVPVDFYLPGDLVDEIERAIRSKGTKTVFSINPEKIMRARKDPALLEALKKADFLIPDGIGTVLGCRWLTGKKAARITGIGLMERLLELSAEKGYRVFIYGGRPEVLNSAAARILERHPSLNLVGTKDGYVPEGEYPSLIEEINSHRTDLLFVGLGSPKQEKWLDGHKPFLKTGIGIGIGGSLDVLSGRVPRCPRGLQKMGLEWLYRLMKEPSRIKRQIVLPLYAFAVLKGTRMSKKG